MTLPAKSRPSAAICPSDPRLAAAFDHVDRLRADGFGGILRAPLIASPGLAAAAGCELYVKLENLQVTGSFKERGAFARMAALSPKERDRGVVAASAGNHAQGVARSAAAMGIGARVFMPVGTPMVKVHATRGFGAEVEIAGDDFDAAKALAQAAARETGAVFIHPFDDPVVLAGQGTVAMEMLEDQPDLDVLVFPVGGGGLAAGAGLAARRIKPEIELVGVQSDLFPAFANRYHGEDRPVGGFTLAEGIAVRQPGGLTGDLLMDLLDDVLLVDERQIERALNLFISQMRVLPEGAGAAGLAAVLANPDRFAGRKVGLVLSGGNVDTRLLSSLLLRDLARSHRLARFRIELVDVPGQLSAVSDIISREDGNVTDVAYHKTFSDLPAKVTYIDISLEAQDGVHMDRIRSALQAAGFRVELAGY
ncbi:threonine dehydratase [Maricaulis sp. W15]|uniref:threonine ammonia-lyase n=1 Tax=Maricaulis sp. W15 TaxID=1772333 RepID=UPI000948C590|nr:threonine ammonia-lyase [Maricaulis sp. W15]OLF77721.1 threonine dehydratase [Maricaulis sp. W15]